MGYWSRFHVFIKCSIISNRMINGNRKCKMKNRFKVALDTANPPHSQLTV